MPAKSIEHRKTDRQPCRVPLDAQKDSAFDQSRTVDISQNGIGLVSQRQMSVDEQIAIEVEISADGEPVLVVGQVKWVRKIPGKDS